MNNSMIGHESSNTGELAIDLLIIISVWFSDKIYDCVLFIINQDQIHNTLIDLKDIFGVIVAILGTYLMIIKISKAKNKTSDSEQKK